MVTLVCHELGRKRTGYDLRRSFVVDDVIARFIPWHHEPWTGSAKVPPPISSSHSRRSSSAIFLTARIRVKRKKLHSLLRVKRHCSQAYIEISIERKLFRFAHVQG